VIMHGIMIGVDREQRTIEVTFTGESKNRLLVAEENYDSTSDIVISNIG
jgi:hypothetical protein